MKLMFGCAPRDANQSGGERAKLDEGGAEGVSGGAVAARVDFFPLQFPSRVTPHYADCQWDACGGIGSDCVHSALPAG